MNSLEEILNLDYSAKQCRYRHWNEDKQCWEKRIKCCICSNTCQARVNDFITQGMKQYQDETMTY